MESGHAFRDKTAHSGNGKCTADDQFSVGLNGNGADCDVQLPRGKKTVRGTLNTETLANERKQRHNRKRSELGSPDNHRSLLWENSFEAQESKCLLAYVRAWEEASLPSLKPGWDDQKT